jgi:hypothetical protein
MRYFHYILASLIASSIALPGRAQQQDAAPKATMSAMPGLGGSANGNEQDATSGSVSDVGPDKTPLTGAQEFNLGRPELRHSYWVPGLSFQNSIESPVNRVADWVSTSYFVGAVSMNVSSSHSQLGLNYSGGGSITNSTLVSNGYYHGLDASQSFMWGRWNLTFLDQFSYLPESAFGFGGVSSLSSPGIGGILGPTIPGLQTNYSPAQSLFSGTGPRYSNSSVVQAQYAVSPRVSVNATSSYGILRFTQGNAIETNDAIFSLGFDYQLTKNDTVGVVYRLTNYRFLGNPQALGDHAVNLAFGRKLTGRLAVQLFGGPDVNTFRQPIGTETERVSYTAGGIATYRFSRSGMSISYNHGLSGGSGILLGSVRDNVGARLSFPMPRRWTASTGVGYALNSPISGSGTGISSQSLHSLYASEGLDYALSHTGHFMINYTFDYQDSTQPICPAGGCGSSYRQHRIWIGLDWHARPFVLR